MDTKADATDSLTAPTNEMAPCALCGCVDASDGDWYRICGPCWWDEHRPQCPSCDRSDLVSWVSKHARDDDHTWRCDRCLREFSAGLPATGRGNEAPTPDMVSRAADPDPRRDHTSTVLQEMRNYAAAGGLMSGTVKRWLRALEEEIARLKAQNAFLVTQVQKNGPLALDLMAARHERDEAIRRAAALREYVQHHENCPQAYTRALANIRHTEQHLDHERMAKCPDPVCVAWTKAGTLRWEKVDCACGLAATLAALEGRA